MDRIEKSIKELEHALDRRGMKKEFKPYLSRIEKNYRNMQETLLSAGMSGLNLAVVFHEVERGVRTIHQVITEGADINEAARQTQELMRLLDGFSALLRRDSKKPHKASRLIRMAWQNSALRLRHHHIAFNCPLLDSKDEGFRSRFAFGLVLGALGNLIDNSLYWLRVRWHDTSSENSLRQRKLYIGLSRDFETGPAIVVADNGTGFQGDDPQNLVRRFSLENPTAWGLACTMRI